MLPRLQDVAAALGFLLVTLEVAAEPGEAELPAAADPMLTEPLSGRDGRFIRQVAELQPALILLDLTNTASPVERWLQRLKTSAATRRIPVVAFGPHVERELLARARGLGADLVVPRSRLQAGLADILRSHALHSPVGEIRLGCQQALSALAEHGLSLMDSGAFFEAHEALEQAWLQADLSQQHVCRALVQTCVAYLHVQRGNGRGAAKLLLRIHQWLDPLPDVCSGINVAEWKANLQALRLAMDAMGPEPTSLIDPALLRPIPRLPG